MKNVIRAGSAYHYLLLANVTKTTRLFDSHSNYLPALS